MSEFPTADKMRWIREYPMSTLRWRVRIQKRKFILREAYQCRYPRNKNNERLDKNPCDE